MYDAVAGDTHMLRTLWLPSRKRTFSQKQAEKQKNTDKHSRNSYNKLSAMEHDLTETFKTPLNLLKHF